MWGQLQRRVSWMKQRIARWQPAPAGADAHHLAQYHLGRGRRAREAGRPDQGVRDARRAVALAPRDPWAHALLGQCLLRTARRDPRRLAEAARALEWARRLAPTNGYFVRQALEIADTQNDRRAHEEILHRAWWAGAPVERWLPDGPPLSRRFGVQAGPEAGVLHRADRPSVGALRSPTSDSPPSTSVAAHPVPA